MKITILVTLFFNILSATFGNDDLDKLALCSLLMKNNNLVRASGILESIKDPNDVQTDLFYKLKGIINFKLKKYDESIKYLILAEKSGLPDSELPEFYETLTRSYLYNKDYKKVEEILESKKMMLMKRYGYYQLLATLYFETHRRELGWSVLNHGIKKFPQVFNLKKQKWFYLFENNLLETSRIYLFKIVDEGEFSPLDLIKIAYRYRQKKDFKTAAIVGEMAWLQAPGRDDIAKELARIHIEAGNIVAAAWIFETLSIYKSEYTADASELWRKAGYPKVSERLAGDISDPKKALKQKITLALDDKNFKKITSYGPSVQRSDLKSNEDIQYTLAYSHFMTGDYKGASNYLKNITRSDLFKKALALRKTMAACSKDEWSCI